MEQLARVTTAYLLFLIVFMAAETRVDGLWTFAREHGYNDLSGDMVLLSGVFTLILLGGLAYKAVKK